MRRVARLAAALSHAGGAQPAAWRPAGACAGAPCRGLVSAPPHAPLPPPSPLLPPAAAAAARRAPGRQLASSSRPLHAAAAAPPAPPAPPATAPSEPPPPWRLVGRVDKPFKLQPVDRFAVVQAGPHQFKVTVDDLIYVEKLHGVDINDKVALPRVLMLGTPARTLVGRPFVPLAEVVAVVEEQVRDSKVIIFKKRRRKNSRRLTGHRQQLTALRVMDILGGDK